MSGEQQRRRRALLHRDGPGCRWCGSDDDSTQDHVIPRSMGGTSKLENLVLSCEPCNQARGGIHGPGSFKPGSVSVTRNGHERFVDGLVPQVDLEPDPVVPYAEVELSQAIKRLLAKYPPKHGRVDV